MSDVREPRSMPERGSVCLSGCLAQDLNRIEAGEPFCPPVSLRHSFAHFHTDPVPEPFRGTPYLDLPVNHLLPALLWLPLRLDPPLPERDACVLPGPRRSLSRL